MVDNPLQQASAEDSLIARYFRPLATHPAARALTDDAAVLPPSSDDLVITTDAIVEGVHFLPDDTPDTIARKALRVNLSDLAAKGATPIGFLLTLALPAVRADFLAPFARALGEDAVQYNCPLLGGDTVFTPGPLMVSVTAFGHIPAGKTIGRDGARVGDRVVVTGTIGDAVLGLDILKNRTHADDASSREHLIGRYRIPQPRGALAVAIRDYAGAAMDVSDGLVGDLVKLCVASNVSARVEASRIPLSEAAQAAVAGGVALERLICGGDDYEILAAIPQNRFAAFMQAAAIAKVAVTEIGEIVAGSAIVDVVGPDGRPLALRTRSFSHF